MTQAVRENGYAEEEWNNTPWWLDIILFILGIIILVFYGIFRTIERVTHLVRQQNITLPPRG